MGEVLHKNIDNIELSPKPGGYKFNFHDNVNDYIVYFHGPTREKYKIEETKENLYFDNCWSVDFEGPNGYKLTNSAINPMAIYSKVILSIRKLIALRNPEMIQFLGYDASQDVMYHYFYKRFLSKLFTKIEEHMYLRNDLFEKLKSNQNFINQVSDHAEGWDQNVRNLKTNKINRRNNNMQSEY